jgi:hypothetical protein
MQGPVAKETVLKVSTTIETPVPAFSADIEPQCDRHSNLYFHLTMGLSGPDEVMRLSQGDFKPALFAIPQDSRNKEYFIDFTVSKSGKVWLLGQDAARRYTVYGFNSDSEQASTQAMDIPDHVTILGFAASEDGRFFFSGFFNERADKEDRGKRYVALHDPSGRLLKQFEKSAFNEIKLEDVGKKLLESPAAIGDDGNFYFLSGDAVRVFAPSGDLTRTLRFYRPDKESTAGWMALSGGLISIQFVTTHRNAPPTMRYLVLDEIGGDVYGNYVPSAEVGSNPVCFSREKGYTFLWKANGKVRLLNAPLS